MIKTNLTPNITLVEAVNRTPMDCLHGNYTVIPLHTGYKSLHKDIKKLIPKDIEYKRFAIFIKNN